MSQLKRRHFLQLAGSTLAAMGLSQLDFFHQAERYGRVLAQSTPRKLALLVGINHYDAVTPLNGCLTDVELQQHLLMYRFGFKSEDIMIISDNANLKPTRENIIKAFQEHLIQKANPGDVVVFHYSGHGSLVEDPSPLDLEECRQENSTNNTCQYNGTIVPQDVESINSDNPEIPVSHIMGQTLFLLKSRVNTDKFTMILDSCHSGGGTRGNVVVRAARLTRSGQTLVPSEAELNFQQEQLSNLGWSGDEFLKRRQAGIAKGVALGSAGRTQEAIDADFGTFHAGAFTYLLTRYLWQLTSTQTAESVYINLKRSTSSLARAKKHRTDQIPTFEDQPGSNFNQQPLFFLELQTPSAEAVITTVKGETIEFWLGGVASQNLKGSGKGVVFSVLDELAQVVAEIEQTSRVEGLVGRGKQISGDPSAIQKGRLLREKIVGIPANPKLQLTLDDESLGADLATAQAELQSKKWVELVPRNQLSESGYFLGRLTETYQQQQTTRNLNLELPPVSSIGLFQADLTPDADSFGRLEEPIVNAINRLQPTFKRLLANQILGQLLDVGQGSPLKVEAEVSGGGQVLQVASRGLEGGNTAMSPVQFRSGTSLQIKVSNKENDQDLYLAVLLINAQGDMDPFYPTDWEATEAESLFVKGDVIELPRPGESILEVHGTSGFPEIMILASKEPLRKTLKALQQIAASRGKSRGRLGGLRGEESLGVIGNLLEDLTELTRSADPGRFEQTMSSDSIPYTTSTMAVLSAVIEVVA